MFVFQTSPSKTQSDSRYGVKISHGYLQLDAQFNSLPKNVETNGTIGDDLFE